MKFSFDECQAAVQPPNDSAQVKIDEPATVAGGIPSMVATFRHIHKQTGVVRGLKTLLTMNQSSGFDCPGCAWPEPSNHRSTFEFCENGAKAVGAEATTRHLDAKFFAQHSIGELATQSDYWHGQQGRLVEPLVLRAGSHYYESISWSDAYALIASELNALKNRDEAVFYTSGRTSNEAAFLYQLFVRQFGTNNLPDCSNLCHESSGWALRESIGVSKGTVQLEDFELCDAIFVIGQNPGTNHPRMLTTLQAAAERGCTIVSINPLPEAALVRFAHPQRPEDLLSRGTPIASLHLPVRIDGDAALLKGIMKELLEEERRRSGQVFDRDFIQNYTDGYEALIQDLDSEDWKDLVETSGISREQMRAAATIWLRSRRIICCWAMGLTQHKSAVSTIQQVINLLLLGGHMGKPGAGACPVRGHSNVQGDRTMGINERPEASFLDRLEAYFQFTPPRHHGMNTVEAIAAMLKKQVKVFFALGGNFLSATPDTERTALALKRCRLTVHVSTKLHRGHLITGEQALILPVLGRTEIDVQASGPQAVSVENSMSIVHASRGTLLPASPLLKSEIALVAELAHTVFGKRSQIPWLDLRDDYGRIRTYIEKVIPGFEHYNERLKQRDGFLLPNAARARRFNTATQRARFTIAPVPTHRLEPDQLLMMTIRTHDQFNTTVYGLNDRYRGIYGGRHVILMNENDIHSLGLRAGQLVDITSYFAGQTRTAYCFVVVCYPIPERCAATYFPETNVLVPLESYADKSHTPTSKSIVIRVTASQ